MAFLDTGDVPDGKSYLYPIPASADPTRYVSADEWNEVMLAVQDVRLAAIAAVSLAFTPQASRPAAYGAGGQAYRLWVDNANKHLMYFDGTTDTDLSAGGGGGGTLPSAYSSGGAGPQVLALDSTRLGVFIRDNATPIAANLFAVQNSTATLTMFRVTATQVGIDVPLIPISPGNTDVGSSTDPFDDVFAERFNSSQAIGTTNTPAAILENPTAATGGSPTKFAPSVQFKASAYQGSAKNSTWSIFSKAIDDGLISRGEFRFNHQYDVAADETVLIIDDQKYINAVSFTLPAAYTSIGFFASAGSGSFLSIEPNAIKFSLTGATHRIEHSAIGFKPTVDYNHGTTIGIDLGQWDSGQYRWRNVVARRLQIQHPDTGTSGDEGILLNNDTAATSGNQKYSPALLWRGRGFGVANGSKVVEWYAQNRPVQDSVDPTTDLVFKSNVTGSSLTEEFTLHRLDGSAEFNRKVYISKALAVGTTQTVISASFINTTAASSGNQQYSPIFELGGYGYETGVGSSRPVKYGMQARPVQGATDPSVDLVFWESINSGAYTEVAYMTHDAGIGLTQLNTKTGVNFQISGRAGAGAFIKLDAVAMSGGTSGATKWFFSESDGAFRLATDGEFALGLINKRWGGLFNVGMISGKYVTSSAASYNALGTEFVIGTTRPATGAATINLVAANTVPAGYYLSIKDESGNAAANNITITPNGADTIDTVAASVTITTNYGTRVLYSNGSTGWFLL